MFPAGTLQRTSQSLVTVDKRMSPDQKLCESCRFLEGCGEMILSERRTPGATAACSDSRSRTPSVPPNAPSMATVCGNRTFSTVGRTSYRCARFLSAVSYFLVKRCANSIRSSGGPATARRMWMPPPSEVTSTSASGPSRSSSNISGGMNRATEPPIFFSASLGLFSLHLQRKQQS